MDKEYKNYDAEQLSSFFGVSVDTIYIWILEGRFSGIDPEILKIPINISENQYYINYYTEQRIRIKEIAAMWEKEQEKFKGATIEDEIAAYEDTIKYFEKKYGGKYEETLKKQPDKASEQLRDEDEWLFVIDIIQLLKTEKEADGKE